MNALEKAKGGMQILAARVLGQKRSFSVNFKITHRCNKNCSYCNITESKEKELTTEQIKQMIDEFKELGLLKLSINGGEPLLRKDIGEIIDYAHEKGVITIMVTNGELLKQRIKDIKNVDILIFSLDGSERTHDTLRGKDSFKKVMAAFKIARKENLQLFTITVLTSKNLDDVDFVLDFCKREGVNMTFQPLYDYKYAAKDLNSLVPNPEKFREAVQKIIDAKKNGYPVFNSNTYLKRLLKWPTKTEMKCYASTFYCNVTPSGMIYPCSNLIGAKGVKGHDGVKLGFKKAFLKLDDPKCRHCWTSCYNEYNALFDLKPEVALSTLKKMK